MRLILAVSILVLAAAPAYAECDAFGDIRAPDFAPQAATVVPHDTMIILDSGILSTGERVIITSQPDAQFSCIVRIGAAPSYRAEPGMVLTALLEPDNEPAADWLGAWQSGIEQFITIEQAEDILDITGEASWGMFDPARVVNGSVNLGSFVASARPKKGRIAFTTGDVEETLPYNLQSDSCSVRMWLAGEFLVASDNDRCGGMNVTFTGLYVRTESY